MYDLHIHTTASDGVLSPIQIIDSAVHIGLQGISITDHDTVDGLEPANNYILQSNLRLKFIPGIELNTEYNESEVHILGYFINYKNNSLINRLVELRNSRYERARKMTEKLISMGLVISFDRVEKLAQGDLIGRPHIAQALMEKGHVFSIKEAFDKYITRGKPAYVPRYKFLPQEAITLIKDAGGIPVLAHPGLIRNGNIVEDIINMGIEGIEVYYPEHNLVQIDNYLKICSSKKLLVTGGSDFHGTGSGDSRDRLGCTGINQDLFDELLNYFNKKRNK